MSFQENLIAKVGDIFKSPWTSRKGTVIPSPEDVALEKNDSVELDEAAVLYADLNGSTAMVDSKSWQLSAEVYKAYLHCCAKLIRERGGEVVAYDGDRVMGIFIGDSKNTNAVKCALNINHAVTAIINPAFREQYGDQAFPVKHTVGIDCSPIRAARTGVRNDNDLVWVGPAANYAAKLTDLSVEWVATWITEQVYNVMNASVKHSNAGEHMWKEYKWTQMNDRKIYGSSWYWSS